MSEVKRSAEEIIDMFIKVQDDGVDCEGNGIGLYFDFYNKKEEWEKWLAGDDDAKIWGR